MSVTFLGSQYDVTTGVFAYLTSEADTTITTAGTYYPVLGTFSNDPFENFTIASDKITYIGAEQYFEIDWNASVSADVVNTTAHVAVKVNSTVYNAQQMGALLKTADESYAIGGTIVVNLAPNDTVQLVATTDSDGDVLTFIHFVTSIRPFFR